MFIARIKRKDRREKIKLVLGRNKNSFSYLGDTYNIDPNCMYITKVWFYPGKVYCSDYTQGYENPVAYWAVEGDQEGPALTGESVIDVVRGLRHRIKHFDLIVLILLGVAIGAACAAAFMAYQNGEAVKELLGRLTPVAT